MKPNVENFIGCDSDYAAAKIVLYGAPFDSTPASAPGRALARRRCGTKALGWKLTALTRMPI